MRLQSISGANANWLDAAAARQVFMEETLNSRAIAVFAGAFLISIAPAQAIDNSRIERLALCQDSWFEWKSSNPARLKEFAADFQSNFLHKGNDAFFTPRSAQTVVGFPIVQVFPESVGMGVGFSVTVNASFDKAKATIEQRIGRRFKCEAGDNMRACELEIGDKKTLTLAADDDPKSSTSLIGCYYFYEK